MYLYISFIFFSCMMCVFSKNIVTKSGLLEVLPQAVALQFFAEVNNTSGIECAVELRPAKCCLQAGDAHCDVVQLLGSAIDTVPEGVTRTLLLVAPLLNPYNRRGFCSLHVDYKSKTSHESYIRDTVRIQFDTTLRAAGARVCDHPDQDPLHGCEPVHCDTHYNGRRSYFHALEKRCLEVPVCLPKENTEIPNQAYNPVSNQCVNKPAITNEDINFIRALAGAKSRPAKDIVIIRTVQDSSTLPNYAELPEFQSQTLAKVVGIKTKPTCPPKTTTPRPSTEQPEIKKTSMNCFLGYIVMNKQMLLGLSGLVFLQCCLICAMMCCFTRSCACCRKKEVVHKFFNYRQDASVTTPLICTSNIDTETTDYQYLSESSNYIDKKIKCYKACQKERKTSLKLSMSDDILSKCLARRDWQRLPRSETIPEARVDEDLLERKEINIEQRKLTDIKVNFQDEKRETTKPVSVKSIVKIADDRSHASLSDSSEKVIRCHSYECEGSCNVMEFKKSSQGHGKTYGPYTQEKTTGSIERGAQACFSNDSIDDLMSERGVLFVGDNASKYSFSSIASSSSRSSRTSKNNALRDVIPFLSRKSKGPSSEPRLNKSKADLDLELLHISRASMGSSTNDSDLCKDLKRIKDSTSSL